MHVRQGPLVGGRSCRAGSQLGDMAVFRETGRTVRLFDCGRLYLNNRARVLFDHHIPSLSPHVSQDFPDSVDPTKDDETP